MRAAHGTLARANGALRALLCAAVLTTPARALTARLPDWASGPASTPSPAASDSVHAHYLFHEQVVSMPHAGRTVITDRGVVRILDSRGANAAMAGVPYDRASAEVRRLRAWTLAPDSTVHEFSEHDAIDVLQADWGTLESDQRARYLAAVSAPPGTLFAWEWVVAEEPLLMDQHFVFGRLAPIAFERFEVELPNGAEPLVHAWGAGVPAATRSGNRWSWERRDLPLVPPEVWSADELAYVDHFVVSAQATDSTSRPAGLRFGSWREVSHWLEALSAPQGECTPEIERKVSALVTDRKNVVRGASPIGRFVQSINYVNVVVGLAHGEGYRPHAADRVLASRFGDCKDKANLFCSLARGAGLEAWLVAVHSQGRDRVRPEWPSPQQFDHCIAALRVPPGTGLSAACDSTPIGPLLYFDPTDPDTPFGALPLSDQGSWALIEHPDEGALVRLPLASAAASLTEWRVDVSLDSTGALRGRWRVRLRGEAASRERAERAADERRWRHGVEASLADWLGPTTLVRLEGQDEPDSNAFEIRSEFAADRFARTQGGRLMSFRTAPFATRGGADFPAGIRRTPLALPGQSLSQTVIVTLPAGWRVEERPADRSRAYDFGSYSARWQERAGTLVFQLETRLDPVTLPADRYADVREWWNSRNQAFHAAVVLERQ
jgi:hypothetical protein